MANYYVWHDGAGNKDDDPKSTGTLFNSFGAEDAARDCADEDCEIGEGEHTFYVWSEDENELYTVDVRAELELSYYCSISD